LAFRAGKGKELVGRSIARSQDVHRDGDSRGRFADSFDFLGNRQLDRRGHTNLRSLPTCAQISYPTTIGDSTLR